MRRPGPRRASSWSGTLFDPPPGQGEAGAKPMCSAGGGRAGVRRARASATSASRSPWSSPTRWRTPPRPPLCRRELRRGPGGRLRLRARRRRAARRTIPTRAIGEFEAGLRRGPDPARRDLFHPDPEPLPDGALRHHRLVGGGQGGDPHLGADAERPAAPAGRDAADRPPQRAPDVALRRRRLRRQGLVLRGPRLRRARLARTAPAGEDRADPPADVQRHRPPAGHRAARAAGRDAGRPAHRAVADGGHPLRPQRPRSSSAPPPSRAPSTPRPTG